MCRWFFSLLFLLYCRESELLQFKSHRLEVNGISIFHSVDSIVVVYFFFVAFLFSAVASAEKMCAHHTYATVLLIWYGQTAKRLHLHDIWMIWAAQPETTCIFYFFRIGLNQLLLGYYWICCRFDTYISFFFICLFVHRAQFSQICWFRMFNAVDPRQFTYIICFFFFCCNLFL